MFSSYYPISIEEIQSKVAKKRGKRKFASAIRQQILIDAIPLDNIKEIINEFGEKIIRVDGDIPVNLPVQQGDRFLFISYDQSILTHGLHRYPAKFFPELPRWLIKKYSREGDWVLDPFSGSGTTNLEALLNKRNSIGIDVDPFSRYLSVVKTTPLNEDELIDTKNVILRKIVNYKPALVKAEDIPIYPYSESWFNSEITLELAYIKKLINSLECSEKTKRFYLMCLSSIIRGVSNADDNCTRTVIRKKLNKQVFPADALKRFVETILVNIPKMIEFSELVPKNIDVEFPQSMDARKIHFKEYFDLALTSPPYANAVDYPRTHQLELYWLGLAQGSLVPLKKLHVGTESVHSEHYKDYHETGISSADKVLREIFTKDPRRGYIAYKYLVDMETNLGEVNKALKTNGRYVVVVGNNKIRGELFETWKYLMEIAERQNFSVDNVYGSEIIKHFIKVPREERINTDWIIELRKRGNAS